MNKEEDYAGILDDVLRSLENIPDNERSEEVGEVVDAAIEDVTHLLGCMGAVGSKQMNLKQYIEKHWGQQTKLARALDVTPQYITKMINKKYIVVTDPETGKDAVYSKRFDLPEGE